MNTYLTGKRILVTGGTGSFGKMFIKEALKMQPEEIIVFSRDENKQGSMKREFDDSRLRFILGDIRDYKSLRAAMRSVDFVIHAAALKWITEVEYNVWEGIQTNIIGAQNIIEAARDAGVSKVVALSTDKAVEPINAYGMAKALQERLMTTANLYSSGKETIFISTRYGNVLGSRGSVVPLFRSLIDAKKPITVTDPSMTRFLLTLKESVHLVLFALEHGVGGEVFVRKMPGHTISDLVDVMTDGYPEAKKTITITGIRPGEKIHEVLVGMHESARTMVQDNYYIILPQIDMPQIRKKYKNFGVFGAKRYASDNTDRLTKNQLRDVLKSEHWI